MDLRISSIETYHLTTRTETLKIYTILNIYEKYLRIVLNLIFFKMKQTSTTDLAQPFHSLVGFKNTGNTCFIATGTQVLLSIEPVAHLAAKGCRG